MKKIVINQCFGGFGLSHDAIVMYAHLSGTVLVFQETKFGFNHYYIDEVNDDNYFSCYTIARDDPYLVQVVEALGTRANGSHSELKVVEIPDSVDWHIHEYDGSEYVAENHRTWH